MADLFTITPEDVKLTAETGNARQFLKLPTRLRARCAASPQINPIGNTEST